MAAGETQHSYRQRAFSGGNVGFRESANLVGVFSLHIVLQNPLNPTYNRRVDGADWRPTVPAVPAGLIRKVSSVCPHYTTDLLKGGSLVPPSNFICQDTLIIPG